MNIKPIHPNFTMPKLATSGAGAFDLFMPEDGYILGVTGEGKPIPLGFAAEVPPGHVALLLPRSGVGAKHGVSLNNTVGVIDSDYRGEWIACLRNKNYERFEWSAGDRLIQVLIVPVAQNIVLNEVQELGTTERGEGGFGSTGTNDIKQQEFDLI